MPTLRGQKKVADPSRIKPRLIRRRWFQVLFAGFCVACLVGVIAVLLILKPHKDAAAEFDLSKIEDYEVPSRIYDRHGVEIGQIKIENRRPVELDDVPYHLIQALTAAEDSRFFQHDGVDYIGIGRAVLRNVRAGELTQGASTITQQLANQSFDLKKEKDVGRKLTEAFLAARIEERFTKSEILELYLNRIYFGSGCYGIEAAARGYFGKSVADIDVHEAATICGLIKSPTRLSPRVNFDESKAARDYVLQRMNIEGMISDAEFAEYKKRPLELTDNSDQQNSYVYEIIRQQVIDQIGFENAGGGGFRIYTTIDRAAQKIARDSLNKNLAIVESHPDFDHPTYAQYVSRSAEPERPGAAPAKAPAPTYLQGAVLMVENRTGGIVAMVGGRNFEHSQYNRALLARRPTGTAFTPFVYAAAFSEDRFPGSIVKDAPIDNRSVAIGGDTGILGEWGNESEDVAYLGEIPARKALAESKNAASVRLGKAIGRDKVMDLVKRAGVESPMDDYDKTLLGSSGATLEEMVEAFTIFPNGGSRPDKLHIVTAIANASGKTIFTEPAAEQVRVVDDIAAYQVHSCLAEALESGTAKYAKLRYDLADPNAAGKTGTAYNFTDLWFLGYNSEVTCGVWAGFDTPQTIYRGAFSNTAVLPVWVEVMNAALPSFASKPVPFPEGAQTVEICSKSGRRATDACYDELPGGADGTRRIERCTHKEVIRRNINFQLYCDYHAGGHVPEPVISNITPPGPAAIPRALPLHSTGPAVAVVVSAPTVIGAGDPYQSIQPVLKARAANEEDDEVRRATPVSPVALSGVEIPIHFDTPKPLEIPEVD